MHLPQLEPVSIAYRCLREKLLYMVPNLLVQADARAFHQAINNDQGYHQDPVVHPFLYTFYSVFYALVYASTLSQGDFSDALITIIMFS